MDSSNNPKLEFQNRKGKLGRVFVFSFSSRFNYEVILARLIDLVESFIVIK